MPRWKETLHIGDIWDRMPEGDHPDLTVVEGAKLIAGRIRAKLSPYLHADSDCFEDELLEIVESLEGITGCKDMTPIQQFDNWWEQLYQWADDHRVWVDLTEPAMPF